MFSLKVNMDKIRLLLLVLVLGKVSAFDYPFQSNIASSLASVDVSSLTSGFSLVEGNKFLVAPASSVLQFLYEINVYDVADCIDYNLVLWAHISNSWTYLFKGDFGGSLVQIGFFVHKSIVVYRECQQAYNDTVVFADMIFKWDIGAFAKHTALNLAFNFIDIYLEMVDSKQALAAGDYGRFGENIGKITSDVLVKSPLDSDWRFNNSNVFMAD